MSALPPGSVIGILGGGQLGRMLALAAAPLGYRIHIFAPEEEAVAADVAAFRIRARYDDEKALRAFAAGCAVVTYEFENVPTKAAAFLEKLVPVRPGQEALHVSQDRLLEKRFAAGLGGRTAPFRAVDSRADLDTALGEIGAPAILKTRRFGYDGKGQARIMAAADADEAYDALSGALILEGFVRFRGEFSILVARGVDGESRCFPPCENHHENGILAETHIPARGLRPAHVAAAQRLATAIADRLSYVGVLACEFFDCEDGPVFNEMAPRVHNSGHWSIEGAATSQFEQHIRAIAGLPLGATTPTAPTIVMRNLLGDDVDQALAILGEEDAHLHLYGKSAARPGRKMGHVTRIRRR